MRDGNGLVHAEDGAHRVGRIDGKADGAGIRLVLRRGDGLRHRVGVWTSRLLRGRGGERGNEGRGCDEQRFQAKIPMESRSARLTAGPPPWQCEELNLQKFAAGWFLTFFGVMARDCGPPR